MCCCYTHHLVHLVLYTFNKALSVNSKDKDSYPLSKRSGSKNKVIRLNIFTLISILLIMVDLEHQHYIIWTAILYWSWIGTYNYLLKEHVKLHKVFIHAWQQLLVASRHIHMQNGPLEPLIFWGKRVQKLGQMHEMWQFLNFALTQCVKTVDT